MSFQRTALTLTWPEGHQLHGLEVKCRRPRIEQIERAETVLAATPEAQMRSSKELRDLLRETVGAALIRWEYTDEDGRAVPPTADGFASIDIEAQLMILTEWQVQAVAVAPDLGKESASGPPSRVATSVMPVTGTPGLSDALRSLPMLSASLESSSGSPATR
jgi:hypothetical protein